METCRGREEEHGTSGKMDAMVQERSRTLRSIRLCAGFHAVRAAGCGIPGLCQSAGSLFAFLPDGRGSGTAVLRSVRTAGAEAPDRPEIGAAVGSPAGFTAFFHLHAGHKRRSADYLCPLRSAGAGSGGCESARHPVVVLQTVAANLGVWPLPWEIRRICICMPFMG